MKKLLAFIFIILAASSMSSTFAQTAPKLAFNHVAIYVMDLNKTTEFYQKVLRLEKISDPFNDGRHAWFKIGEHAQLHVVSGNTDKFTGDNHIHFAFTVADLDQFIKHLGSLNVPYKNMKGENKQMQVRPDKVRQIYVQDPDNNWIEINDDRF